MVAASAGGDQAGYRTTGYLTSCLHQHVQVITIGKAPQDLAHVIPGEGSESLFLDY